MTIDPCPSDARSCPLTAEQSEALFAHVEELGDRIQRLNRYAARAWRLCGVESAGVTGESRDGGIADP